jgi:SPP1 family predicted phage head-tail adaptor
VQSVSNARGADGSVAKTYNSVVTIWADVKEDSQNETIDATKQTVTSNLTVVVRYSSLTSGINPTYQLVYNGSNYMIKGIITDERKIYRTITAKLIT